MSGCRWYGVLLTSLCSDYVPFRNSKLTRMLQPSLSGDARISVVCTINPSKEAIGESTSTLLFAQRIKKVQVSVQKSVIGGFQSLIRWVLFSSMRRRKRLSTRMLFSKDTGRKLKNLGDDWRREKRNLLLVLVDYLHERSVISLQGTEYDILTHIFCSVAIGRVKGHA